MADPGTPEYVEIDSDLNEYGSYHLIEALLTVSYNMKSRVSDLHAEIVGFDSATSEDHIEIIEDELRYMLEVVDELKERKESTDDETFGHGDVRYELRSVGYGLDEEWRAELEDRAEYYNPKRSTALVLLHFDEIVNGNVDESVREPILYDEDAYNLFHTVKALCKHGLEDSLEALVDVREECDDEDTTIEERNGG